MVPPVGGVQMSFSSTSGNDTDGGSGINTMDMHYLDINLDPQVEEITLNGVNDVLSLATDVRFIQCMHLLTVGSSRQAEGTISAFVGTQNYSQIAIGENRCSSSARMVPRGKRAIIIGVTGSSVSGTASAGAIIAIASTYFEPHNYTELSILIPYASIGEQDGSEAFNFPIPLVFPEGVVIAMVVTVDKAATISGSWYGYIENDPNI